MARRMILALGALLLGAVVALAPSATAGGYPTYGYGYSYSYPAYNYGYTYSYYPAHYQGSRYFPAGNYAKVGNQWYLYGYGAFGGYENYKAPSLPSYTDKDWKSKLLEVAKDRDEQVTYLKALQALGVPAPAQYPPNAGIGYNTYGHAASYLPPPSGQTLYGYTYETLRQAYGETNLNALYQQSARLTQGAQALAGQANTEFSGLVSQAGDNAARVAEVLARAQAAATVFKATEPQASSTTSTRTTVTGQASGGVSSEIHPTFQTQAHADWLKTVGAPLCGSCHGQKDPKGGFAIAAYPAMDADKKQAVLERLLTSDKDKRMPRLADGTAGTLTAEQLKAFITY